MVVFGLTPLAGLFTLLLVLAPICIVVAPRVHVLMVKQGAKKKTAVSIALVSIVILFFALAFTGLFTFA